MNTAPLQIIVVSNRGPFSFSLKDGEVTAQRGAGGLVTAISSIAKTQNVLWVSCALSQGDIAWAESTAGKAQWVQDMNVQMIVPDASQYQGYYNVISNPLLWFIQHELYDTPRHPVINETTWKAWSEGYVAINRQFAEAVAESAAKLEGQIIVMVQDYQLYLTPRYLRELLGNRVVIQFFLHIPCPGPDAWRILPLTMRRELLGSLLQADIIGFQTERDTRRFLQTCADVLPGIRVVKPWRKIVYQDHETQTMPYPISIDVESLKETLASEDAQRQRALLRANYNNLRMILRVDRVEPSKNVLRGLMAYRDFLTTYPEYLRQVYLLALLVPSRGEISEYKDYLRDIMVLSGEINATLGDSNWEPVRILLGNNYPRAIAALSQYDVLMVNPLTDGMNLVAKEGVVINQCNGVLILYEEAGVADEFRKDALLIAPFDVYNTREAIHTALNMSLEEKQLRAANLAQQVMSNDIHKWFVRQLEDAERNLSNR